MPKVRIDPNRNTGAVYAAFMCPGCGHEHSPLVKTADDPNAKFERSAWGFNGDINAPTFTPSIKTWWSRTADGGKTKLPDYVCHSFVRDGRIEFLSDCTHALANQTVDLPELKDDDASPARPAPDQP